MRRLRESKSEVINKAEVAKKTGFPKFFRLYGLLSVCGVAIGLTCDALRLPKPIGIVIVVVFISAVMGHMLKPWIVED